MVNCDFVDYTTGLRRAVARRVDLRTVEYTGDLAAGTNDSSSPDRIRIGRPRARSPRSALEAVRLLRMILRTRPDVVHVQATANPTIDLALSILPRLRRTLVVTVHDIDPHPGDPGVFPLAFPMIRHLARSATRLIIHAEALRSSATARGVDPERIVVVPHGELGSVVTGEDWTPRPSTGATLMVFGRLHAYKGLSVLVEALPRIRARVPDARILVCGRGAELDELLRNGLPDGCEVNAGWIPAGDVAALFDASTVVVLPYLEASQSGVAALAAGLARATIVSDVGGLAEAVGFGEIGEVVPPGDVEALADAAVGLLLDEERRHGLERRAFEASRSGRLSWPVIAERTVEVYRLAMARPT